jgi:hypothetical protein
MNYSKETHTFVRSLLDGYTHYDKLIDAYDIHIDDIDADDLYKLCSLIMRDSPDSAIEATSIDNPEYERSMLPALNYFMAHPSMSSLFTDEWQKGILSYLRNRIISLLEDDLENYNWEHAA